MNRMNDKFKEMLSMPIPARQFVLSIADGKGERGEQLRSIAAGLSDQEILRVITRALNDGGVTDEYQFIHYVIEKHRTGTLTACATASDEKAETESTASSGRPESTPFVGTDASGCLDRIITHAYAASLNAQTVAYIIQADASCGKTRALKELETRAKRRGLIISHMSMYEQQKSASAMLSQNCLHLVDDIDKYIDFPQFESAFNQIMLTRMSSFVATCTSTKRIEKFAAQHGISIVPLGEYTAKERNEITSHITSSGYSLTMECCERVQTMLSTFGSKNRLKDALTARLYLLYPVLHYVKNKKDTPGPVSFSNHDVLKAVAQTLGKTLDVLSYQSAADITAALRTTVKGQDQVIADVIPPIQLFLTGSYDPSRPAGVMLFYGPSGVGKTELAHAIADQFADGVFHTENMSEYMEKHTASRFIGSPPGYLGYSETPAILQYLDKHTRGVLLLDEIEKAHPDIMTFLMQLFDTGCITDGSGKPHYARGWIIILTSNLKMTTDVRPSIGFGSPDTKTQVVSPREEIAACNFFRPEVLNRITSVHRFVPFTDKEREAVARTLLQKTAQLLSARGIAVDIEQYVPGTVAAFDAALGARAMRTYIDMTVLPEILKNAMERTHESF